MIGSRPAMVLAIGILAMLLGGAAQAQDLAVGKSPAQLYSLNCSVCHRSPQGLAAAGDKAGGLFGLESFLAKHYTASGRSAAMIADYLKSMDKGRAPQRRSRHSHRALAKPQPQDANSGAAKTDGKPKTEKPAADKPKADETKPAQAKSAEKKPADGKPLPHAEAKRERPKPTSKKTD